MKTVGSHLATLTMSQILFLSVFSGPALAQPKLDGDYPGFSAGVGLEYVIDGNPLDQGDLVYSLWGSYRPHGGPWGINGALGYAHPTSAFARSLGSSAELVLVDFSVVYYLGYPPEIDRSCGGKEAAPGHIQAWHCGRRFKSEPYVFAGPGLALLWVDDAFPNLPITDASQDYFTVNFGVGVRLYRTQIDDPSELAPGLWYQAGYRKSPWYLRPEIRGRWFPGGQDEIDWSVGLGVGYTFDRGSSHGALCMQIEETCHLARRVAEQTPSLFAEQARDLNLADEHFASLQARRNQLEEYRLRLRDSGADCGRCIEECTTSINGALDKLRRPPADPE